MNPERHPEPGPVSPASVQPAPTKPRSNSFFRKRHTPLARDDARRQGDISQLAFLTFRGTGAGAEGGRDAAIAFLNTEDSELGGRPLAIATASAEGYARVAAAIHARAATAAPAVR